MIVAVMVPAQDSVSAMFAHDLARMTAYVAQRQPDVELKLMFSLGSALPDQRESLLDAALMTGADAMLFLDSDMRFPADTLERLLAHDKPFVATNYTQRKPPFRPVAHTGHDYVYTTPDSPALEDLGEHGRTGLGVALVRRAAVALLERPYFMIGWDLDGKRFVLEDAYFMAKLRAAGVPLLLDHNLSDELGHMGIFEYLSAHAVRAAERARGPKIEVVRA